MGKKNRLIDLNDHLFEQLERLNDEELTGANLRDELDRAKGICDISKAIIANGQLMLAAQKLDEARVLDRDLNSTRILIGDDHGN